MKTASAPSSTDAPTDTAGTYSTAQSKTPIKILSIAGILVFVAFEYYFFRVSYHPVGYVGSAVPLLFGVWRILTEKDPYQKKRIIFIVSTYLLFWMVFPVLLKIKVPVYFVNKMDPFPQLHTVGSLTFFLFFFVVLLVGKRADCGWCCPCVTARETIGYAFRDKTPRNKLWWRLRHLKLLTVGFMLYYLVLMIIDPPGSYNRAGKYYYTFSVYGYYASFLLIPFTGNRNFCRILCPFAGLWGMLSVAGFYRIRAERTACTGCRRCEQVCDMGIPIAELVKKKGEIRTIECMGCGRCVTVCPNNVLSIYSAWSFIKKTVSGNAHGTH